MEDEELVAAYVRYAVGRRKEDFRAWDSLSTLVSEEPERAWDLLLRIVDAAPDDRLGYVGAGPLEDLLHEHHALLGARIEARARRDARFREALRGVWLSPGAIPRDLAERLRTLAS